MINAGSFYRKSESSAITMDENVPGRYVLAPRDDPLEDPNENEVINEEEDKFFTEAIEDEVIDRNHSAFQMPKMPKMAEKSNAHEKLIEWKKYKRSIDYYFKLAKQSLTTTQKLQLLYLGGGAEIQKALEHFKEPSHGDDKLSYEEMMTHMEKFFQTGVDSLAYMLQFFNTKQKENEPFADFAQRLKSQADLCELGTARENLLKAQIQKGARNAKVFASAESWVNKSLEDIIGLGIADETGSLPSSSKIKQNQSQNDDDELIGRVSDSNGQTPRRFPRAWRRGGQRGGRSGQRNEMNRAGSYRQYPYSSGRGRTDGEKNSPSVRCYSCNKIGHFARECRNRGVFLIGNENEKVETDIYE